MMVVLSLLFLPAAGNGTAAQYWSRQRGGLRENQPVAWYLASGSRWIYPAGTDGQVHFLFAVRLASREDCLDVMSVVFGLLFLPAAGMGYGSDFRNVDEFALLWSSAAASSSSSASGLRAFRITHGRFVQLPLAEVRQHRYAIRLASRENCQL